MRLLKDLLEHEVFVVAEFDLLKIELKLANLRGDFDVVDRGRAETLAGNARDGVIVQRDRLRCVRHDGARIRCNDVLAVSDANHQWRTLARNDEHVRLFLANHRDGVRASDLAQRSLHGLLKITCVKFANQVCEHFGIGLAVEDVPLLGEVLLQRRVVLDDAVVDDRDAVAKLFVVAVWVCVLLRHTAVRRPTGVRDANRSLEPATVVDELLDVRDATDRARNLEATIHDGDTRRVVPAILKALQAFEKNVCCLATADVGNDSAHMFEFRSDSGDSASSRTARRRGDIG